MNVDIFTTDKGVEDLIIREYSGKLFEHQFKKIDTPRGRVYAFYDLDKDRLMELFDENDIDYVLRDDNLIRNVISLGKN